MSDKQNGIFEKIENTLSVFLLILLCVLSFIQLIAERFFHIPLLGVEGATVNFVFLFACFTSIITWRAHKHIRSVFKVRNYKELASKIRHEGHRPGGHGHRGPQ